MVCILGHFGEGGVTETSARIIAVVSTEASSPAQPHSVCATTVDDSGVYVCYLKGIVCVFVADIKTGHNPVRGRCTLGRKPLQQFA